MIKERKIVLVEWEDITATDTNWRSEEEATDWADDANSIARQAGFLVSKDDEYIVLTDSYIPGLDLLGSIIRIPIPTVKFIKEISLEDFKNI